MELKEKLSNIDRELVSELKKVKSTEQLEKIKVRYLSRKGKISLLLRDLKNLPVEQRPQFGKLLNEKKEWLEQEFARLSQQISVTPQKRPLSFDYTLPGRKGGIGKLHPITQGINEIIEIFYGMGFEVALGPDVETDYYNFEALNFPPDHPARDMQDTFYVGDDILLRTHTSPVQIRVFEKRKPPVRILAPGRSYRCEAINARSFCIFHQVEGFYVDENVTFADLKGTLAVFVKRFFGEKVEFRFRPSFFPFTEPSVEVDISCLICKGKGCSLCKQRGWLEILGAGMIDPNVFKAVGYDSEKYSGYAFGLGVERPILLKYGIDDIRLFYENDLRFLRQF
ncbi:MAG: phenylalanine--tRNA ligase subunit alpha [candidate division Zixibacteria bacterium]|nr:phenylalanine--tRNA ligase subunit alpha [candidate division Zixibacteria bacterium]